VTEREEGSHIFALLSSDGSFHRHSFKKLQIIKSTIILSLGIYEDPTGPHISNDFLYGNQGGKTI
jgi:hypothetical protein